MSLMNASRKIWQFICAVIALIAVQFAPALARTHTDQGHRPHLHVHHHAVPHGMIAVDAPVAHHFTKAAFTKAAFTKAAFTEAAFAKAAFVKPNGSVLYELFLTADQSSGSAPIDLDGCVDGCCGAGLGCCGGAALAATSQCVHPEIHSHRLDFSGAVLAAGIEPASLRKPPRSLA
ncbi:hypothetical protein LJR220_004659 [Bradyrhizobium sp. LjRoot220]|uniref:hypothetical protein n=1 Tax=Bradyrhizobium sp. LjRoot220 TaxID=3342284 RepID=UPI003ECDC9D4